MAKAQHAIRPATDEDCAELAATLRASDLEEMRAVGVASPLEALLEALAISDASYAWRVDGRMAAAWGVAAVSADPRIGSIWMLGSPLVDVHQRYFLRRICRPMLKQLLGFYPVLVNAVDARSLVSLRWLAWMGFEVSEPVLYGAENRPFRFVSIRRHPSPEPTQH